METIKLIFSSLRPKQWLKNFLVFSALVFSEKRLIFDFKMIAITVGVFISFCLTAGGIYLINDILDRDRDKVHPEKRNRPIASGKLNVHLAVVSAFICLLIGLILGWILSPKVFLSLPVVSLILVVYIIVNFLYSYWLKHIVLIDVFCVSVGFVLRVVAGGEAINVEISAWIILCTILLSLFLAFSKRRSELTLSPQTAVNHRASLAEYSPYFLDQMISVTTASTVVAYSLWTMWPSVVEKFGTKHLPLTIPFVCYGIFRYLYLVHQKGEGGDPTRLFLKDKPLILNVGLWLLCVILIIYMKF